MVYTTFLGKTYDNEEDETCTREFGDPYKCLKREYPRLWELPKNEVQNMCKIFRMEGDTVEDGYEAVKKYLNNHPSYGAKTHKDNFVKRVLDYIPEYNTLREAKEEMEKVNKIGYDNYAHRLAMCRIGQMGSSGAILSPSIGFGLGILKEVKDVYDKSYNGNKPWRESISDSWKDMKNNIEGLNWGLNNPSGSCRLWLQDLDYDNNEWKTK